MTRRLSVAMAFSAAIHLAAFVIADRFLLGDFTPSVISTPLVVTIDSLGVPANTAADDPPAPAEEPPAVAPPSKPVEKIAETAKTTPAPEEELPAPVAPSESVANAVATIGPPVDIPYPDAADAVLVTNGSDAERSVPATAALTAGQEKMLSRKLGEWTQEWHDTPEEAAGVSWKQDGQEYRARVSKLPADEETGIQRMLVEVSTIEDGKRFSTKFEVKRLAFSSFAEFVNRWNPDVQLHDDELDGRFHSNSRFSIAYDGRAQPVFREIVTTSAGGVDMTRTRGGRRHDEVFQGGLETGVRKIQLPRHFASLSDRRIGDGENVHRLDEDTRITFRSDGSYAYQVIDSGSPGQTGTLSAGTTYFIADKGAAVHVRGVVKGKVLVYSPQRIVIEGDLVYEKDPEITPGADDMLGLVSDRNVEVAPPDVTGPGDLRIYAAIYAKRRFTVRKTRFGERALLYLYGSLSAGSLSGTEPRYATKIRFDPRLEKMRPPGFPMTDRYEVESWDADWTVKSIDN